MNGFLKFVLSVVAIVALIASAFVLFEKLADKFRVKGDYLECDDTEDFEQQ